MLSSLFPKVMEGTGALGYAVNTKVEAVGRHNDVDSVAKYSTKLTKLN